MEQSSRTSAVPRKHGTKQNKQMENSSETRTIPCEGTNKKPEKTRRTVHVSPGIEPGGIVFPSQNNNIVLYLFGVLQAMWELEISSSAPGRL